jgi:hypothetical protein
MKLSNLKKVTWCILFCYNFYLEKNPEVILFFSQFLKWHCPPIFVSCEFAVDAVGATYTRKKQEMVSSRGLVVKVMDREVVGSNPVVYHTGWIWAIKQIHWKKNFSRQPKQDKNNIDICCIWASCNATNMGKKYILISVFWLSKAYWLKLTCKLFERHNEK